MYGAERVAGLYSVADFFPQDEADGRIDRVFLPLAAAAEHHAGYADLLALNRGDVPARGAVKRL